MGDHSTERPSAYQLILKGYDWSCSWYSFVGRVRNVGGRSLCYGGSAVQEEAT